MIILEIDAGSMSMWMILAFGQNLAGPLTTRSSKRAPTAKMTSALCMAMLAVKLPCMPSMPRNWRSVPGKPPSPIRVLVTGRFSDLAISVRASEPPPRITPPPE
ncbi:hypothetical protein D3C76_1522820 [compost metagenome]